MIPAAKQPAVTRALQTAFGVKEYEVVQRLTGWLSSALAFKIIVRKNPYLLKILRTEVISDPRHEFACMQAAAEAGLAPRIWYASVEDRILISDFVEARPFPEDALPLVALTIRRIHALPNFPRVVNYLDAIDGFIRRFQAVSIFYAPLLLLEVSRFGLSIDADQPAPGFRDFHRDLISGKIDMSNAEPKLQYGLIHLRQALRSMRTPRFAEALARVSKFHASD